ncbi:MAG: TlpA disulfide reductase family protein [Nitrososphaerales archaeon]
MSLPPTLSSGEKAPDFTMTDTDGNTFSLTDLQEKVVVLNFMATWCQSCVWEMGDLIELYNTYSIRNIVFLSVSIEPVGTVKDVIDFKSKYCAEWAYVLDDGSLFSSYEVQVLPTTYVIDGSGTIIYGRTGIIDRQDLSNVLDELTRA